MAHFDLILDLKEIKDHDDHHQKEHLWSGSHLLTPAQAKEPDPEALELQQDVVDG